MKRRDKHQWAKERHNDQYFIKAKKEGYRARSAYKLIEIQEKFSIIPKNGNILDLGCAPGAWLQVIQKNLKSGEIYGIDLLDITPISGVISVNFLKADIFSKEAEEFLEGKIFDCIVCDIAPNFSGHKDIDHLKSMNISEEILIYLPKKLKLGGNFCIKLFDGALIQEYVKNVKQSFESVKFFKPKSSHLESNEFYLVGQRLKKENRERIEE